MEFPMTPQARNPIGRLDFSLGSRQPLAIVAFPDQYLAPVQLAADRPD